MTRCDSIAQTGLSLLQLREECARRGFVALPLDVYLADACATAGASLQALWKQASKNCHNAWIALAHLADMPAAHIQLMLRLWFVWQDRPVRARGASTGRDATFSMPPAETSPEELEALLTGVESDYPESRKSRLRQLLTEVEA
jgi:hypothetical protein